MYLGDLMDVFVQRNYKVRTYPTQKYRLKPRRGGVWPNSPTALRSDDWPSLVNCHLQAVICILSFLQQMFSCGVEAKKAEPILLTIILLIVLPRWRSLCLVPAFDNLSRLSLNMQWRGEALPAAWCGCRSSQVSILFYSISGKIEHQQKEDVGNVLHDRKRRLKWAKPFCRVQFSFIVPFVPLLIPADVCIFQEQKCMQCSFRRNKAKTLTH